jgi:hypothetical protein
VFARELQLLRSVSVPDDWQNVEATDVIYVCHDVDRTFEFRGRRYAPVIDTMQDVLSGYGLRGLTVASPFSYCTGDKAHGTVLAFNRSFARERVSSRATTRAAGAETWNRILDAAKPKGVIAVQPSRGLCEAGRQAGIWVADAQHGWIPSTEIPGEPYYTQEYWTGGDDAPFPDYFLVWDEASAANLQKVFHPRAIDAVHVGNMWCERFAGNNPRDPVVRETAVGRSDRPRALLTLQWKTVTVEDSLPPALRRVIRKTCGSYEWMIRLHPCHVNDTRFARVKASLQSSCAHDEAGLTWHTPMERPLPALLSAVDLHITFNSSSALEAAHFNVFTGFLDRRAAVLHSGMAHLFEQRLAEVMPEDEESMEAWVHRQMATRRRCSVAPRSADAAASRLLALFD